MKQITIVVTENGWTETLELGNITLKKEYVRDRTGSHGLQQSWEYEEEVPDNLVEALEDMSSGLHNAMYGLYGYEHSDDADDEEED